MKRFLCMMILLWLPAIALAEKVGVSVGGSVVGYSENKVTVTAPFAGEVTLRVKDDLNVYRTMTFAAQEGKNTFTWDGLGENEQRLPTGKHTMTVEMTDRDGERVTGEANIKVEKPKQAVLFALSNADCLYLDHADEWHVEFKMVRTGKVTVDFYRADDLTMRLDRTRQAVRSNGINEYEWDGKVNGKTVEPGEYVLRLYADDSPAFARDVPVRVEAVKPAMPITLTQTFMPERGMSDEEIWNLMMQPSVVLDVKNTMDYEVRSAPGEKAGTVLGTVHGQSQGLNLLEIGTDGYVRVGAWNHETGSYMEGYVPANKIKQVEPRREYGLLLDKAAQSLTVYHEGKPIATIPVSTGLVTAKKMIRETAAGAFLLQEHMVDFSNKGFTYSYVIRYDGGNLLHQAGYQKKNDRPNFTIQGGGLGLKASHGCVRMSPYQCNGVDAYWIWTHIPAGTRLFVLDDEEQRTWEAQAVAGQIGNVRPTDPQPLTEGESELVLTVGGDAVLGTREKWWNDEISLPGYLAKYGMGYPFRGLQSGFAADDMTFVNLECVLKDNSSGEDKDKEYRFRGLPEYTRILQEGSIEQVNIANNHYIDYGTAGRDATRKALDEAGMPYSGFGYVHVWEQDGHRIGFAGCRETTYKSDKTTIRRDVAALRRAGCDVIIYSCHWGKEYSATHNALQEEMAREAMLAGVDIIIGTHPHVVQGIGTQGNTVVLWSLGNLMFGGTHDMTTFDATLAQIRLRFSGDKYTGCTVSYIPILTSSADPANDFHPVIAEAQDKARILQKIQADTAFTVTDEMWFPAR